MIVSCVRVLFSDDADVLPLYEQHSSPSVRELEH